MSLSRGALGVGQLAADAGHRAAGHVDQEAAGQVDLLGQPGALVADRVLGDLHQHLVAGLQRGLDRALLARQAGGVPVDLTGVEDGVAALADVDERGLHAGQHVLHAAEVDVAGEGGRLRLGHVVLDEDVVLEDGDLRALAALADDHLAVDGLAAGEELALGQDRRAAAAGVAAVAAALALGLEAGGAGHAADVVVAGGPAVAAGPLGAVVVVGVVAAGVASPPLPLRRRRRRRRRVLDPPSASSVVGLAPSSSAVVVLVVVGVGLGGLVRRRRRRRRPRRCGHGRGHGGRGGGGGCRCRPRRGPRCRPARR